MGRSMEIPRYLAKSTTFFIKSRIRNLSLIFPIKVSLDQLLFFSNPVAIKIFVGLGGLFSYLILYIFKCIRNIEKKLIWLCWRGSISSARHWSWDFLLFSRRFFLHLRSSSCSVFVKTMMITMSFHFYHKSKIFWRLRHTVK